MVLLTMGLLATTVAMSQPYEGHGTVGHDHPWAPVDARADLPRAFDAAPWAPARALSPWTAYGDAGGLPGAAFTGPSHVPFSEGLAPAAGGGAFGRVPGPLGYPDPGFQPWTPQFPGAPSPLNTRSGGNPGMGFWDVAPTAFRYRRVPVNGGPEIYAHGWLTPWGDYEGVMIIRGSAGSMFQGHGR